MNVYFNIKFENIMTIESYDVLGVPISAVNPNLVLTTIVEWSSDNIGRYICIRDVASLMVINDSHEYSSVHDRASLITPDGMPLVLLGKMKGYKVERTCGPDLLDLVCKHSVENNLSHYFYGGKPGVAKKMADYFQEKYPNIKIVGTESPPFQSHTSLENENTLNRFKNSGADIIWVGLSSPKQDIWMSNHYKLLPQTLIGVGAAFDFHSGEVKRAPVWMQKMCLEWLYRLSQEPRRLWRRYLVLAPKFLFRVLSGK